MWPGCSHSQDRAHPAVQRQCNNVTPAPVVHPANGIQINMVAPQDPEERRVVDGPAPRQQDDAQSRQHFQRLHHNVASTRYQHPNPGDSVRTSWYTKQMKKSRKANPDYYSSLHVTAQSGCANENTGRQRLYNGGQDEERIGQSLSRYSQKGSYVNNSATLQQKHLSCAFPVGTSSVAPQRKTVGVTAGTLPFRGQAYSGPLKQTSSPLQCALLKGNCRPGRSSLDAHSCEQIGTQNRLHSRTSRYQQQLTRPSALQEIEPLTDVQIHDYIAKEVNQYRRTQSTGNLPTSSGKGTQQHVEVQRVSSAALGIAALGKALPVDSSKGSKVNAVYTQTSDCPTVPLERHSTDYVQLMRTVAATGTKNEDKSPVVLISRPGRTLGERTEKEHCDKPKAENTSVEFNINRNLEELHKVTGVSCSPKRMTVKEAGDARLKPVDNVGWTVVNQDTFPNRRKTSEDQHCHITDQEVIAHPMVTSSVDQIQIHSVISISTDQSELLWNQASHQCVMEDASSVHSQTDLCREVTGKIANVQDLPLLPESKSLEHALKLLKDSKYEDISDYEDVSQVMTKLPNTQHEKCSFLPCAENPQYEDISEDESPKKKRLAQEYNKKQSLFENEGHGHAQAQVETESLSEEKPILLDTAQLCTCPCFGETDDGFEHICPKCDSERQPGVQTNHSFSCSPSYEDFKDGDEGDDQMDDFIVLPISITSIIFEPENEIQNIVQDDSKSGDKNGHGDMVPTDCPVPKPVAASASYNMEVFDTVKSFLQAKSAQFVNSFEIASGGSTPEHEMVLEGDTHTPKRSTFHPEPEDSSETDDSCDYSAPLRPETDKWTSEHNKATNVQKGQSWRLDKRSCMEKLGKLIEAKASSKKVHLKTIRQTDSKNQDIIIVDSDTEDESDQNFRKNAKRKRSPSSGLMDYASWGQEIGHPPETLDSLHRTVKGTADLPVPQRPELSHSTATSGQHLENKAACKHVQQDTNRKNIESVIILDSDTEVESDQNHQKENSERSISSGFMDNVISSCTTQKIHSPEIVDSEDGPTEGKLQEVRSSAERSDLSLCVKNAGQLIEAEVGSEYVQHKSTKQTTPKRVKVFFESDKVAKKDAQISKEKATERTPPSAPKDRGVISPQHSRQSTEIVNRLSGTPKKRPRTTILISEQSPERWLRPVIPRLLVTSMHNNKLQLSLLKERVSRQAKDETLAPKSPTATRKKKYSFENKTLSKVQASIITPRPVSRQLSLPNPEGPSTTMMDDLRTNYDSRRQARPGSSHSDRVPKQRRNSHESATPLMKRAMSEAKHLTKARNRDIQREHASNVGDGYKWLESRKKAAMLTKRGSASERKR